VLLLTAEEVALPLFILLKPEPGAGEDEEDEDEDEEDEDEEDREEFAERMRRYRIILGCEEDWEREEWFGEGTRIEPEDIVEIAKPPCAVEPAPLVEEQKAMDKELGPQKAWVSDAEIEASLKAAIERLEEEAPTPLRDRIVYAYSKAVGGKFNQNVDLANIRRALPDVAREELDAELERMHFEKEITLSGTDNQSGLTPETRAVCLDLKGQSMHGLLIASSSHTALAEELGGLLALLGGGS